MNRRSFLVTGLAASLAAQAGEAGAAPDHRRFIAADHPLQASWQAWKRLCLSSDGRVIDGFQDDSSHSEGQGYALALAAFFGDGEAAARITSWTEANLALRRDGLLAWRWRPGSEPHVTDRNNASDGDLFYAWGLMLLAELEETGRQARLERAGVLCRALLRHCTAPHPDGSGRLVLLPGVSGFRRAEGLVINPSYTMGRALRDLSEALSMPELSHLAQSGEAISAELADQGPVPDWVMLTTHGPMAAPEPFSGVSGYEAMRVALFALWSGQGQHPAVQRFAAMTAVAGGEGGSPVVFDPEGRSVTERSSHPGYAAIAALAGCVANRAVGAPIPVFDTDQPYYPATLHLMALVIQVTTYPRCVPI